MRVCVHDLIRNSLCIMTARQRNEDIIINLNFQPKEMISWASHTVDPQSPWLQTGRTRVFSSQNYYVN